MATENVMTKRHCADVTLQANHEPQSYREAMDAHDADKWSAAIDKEIDSLEKNKTWRTALTTAWNATRSVW